MSNDNIIPQIDNLQVQYEIDAGIVKAVGGVSFSLKRGKTIGLIGETGAGKTTIVSPIMELLPTPPARVTEGRMQSDDKDLSKMKERERRKIRGKHISMIFQDPTTSLNPIKQAGDQIIEVIRIYDKISRKEAQEKAVKMLEMVGTPGERFNEFPHQFSGGMKQRIGIAIALACQPELLIVDEPTTALGATVQAQVLDLIKELQNKLNISVILITHDLGVVAQACDHVAVVYAGDIVEIGEAKDIFGETMRLYMKGLFISLPNIKTTSKRLTPIPGMILDPCEFPGGCSFVEWRPYKDSSCEKSKPSMVEVFEGHFVRCCKVKEMGADGRSL